MSGFINKALDFLGWEVEEDREEESDVEKDETNKPEIIASNAKRTSGKVVNIHTNNQFKVIIIQPETIDDAQEICDHLKSKKAVVVNLEGLGKEEAQRIVDFLSGAVYALDGGIQKVSYGIFVIAPNNVDLMGEFKEELKSKGVFPWIK
ncbi:MAG: cell division protein SepF [Clostridiales bacterium]